MDDDGVDRILFMSNQFCIHLSYTNYSHSVLPGEREQAGLEKLRHRGSFTLPYFHVYWFFGSIQLIFLGLLFTHLFEPCPQEIFFSFYWRVVDLQCCFSFWYTEKWFSLYIYIKYFIYYIHEIYFIDYIWNTWSTHIWNIFHTYKMYSIYTIYYNNIFYF